MNPLQGLSEYLGRVERRLKVLTWSRGAALTAGAALGFTVAGVLIANHFAFSNGSVVSVRVLLFPGPGGGAGRRAGASAAAPEPAARGA